MDSTFVYPREVMEGAIKSSAVSLVLVHNHPSGNVEPSPEDIRITEKLIDAGKILSVPIIDHVIVSDGQFYSLAEKGICTFV